MDITSFLKQKGFEIIEGYSQQCPQQTHDLIYLTKTSNISVMEIGFNGGHSAETFLKNNNSLTLTSFDLGFHDYVPVAKEYIDITFPNRHTLVLGDSRETLPKFIKNNPDKKFDVIFIDGGHDYEVASTDMTNCFHLAHENTIVIIDDTIFTKEWELHFNIGPTKTWLEFVKQNIITEYRRMEYSIGRGMSWGKYNVVSNINKKWICTDNETIEKKISTPINIFILCFNESILLPHTIRHYRERLPSSKITILDNYSTDNSVEIAKNFENVKVEFFDSKNIQNDYIFRDLKNNCWKGVDSGWIIVADMDEWLCVDEPMLEYEKMRGVTILSVKGYNITSKSITEDLSDINLQNEKEGVHYEMESKKLCFLKDKIIDINYDFGAHTCNPIGIINYSDNIYVNKHMVMLGLPYLRNRYKLRYERTTEMRAIGLAIHYSNEVNAIDSIYKEHMKQTKPILELYGENISFTELCQIMEKVGSDKGSTKPSKHNYTKLYYDLFSKIRYKKLRIFELGIGTNNVNIPSNMGLKGIPGASLRGWRDFFSKSQIFGADIDRDILFFENRIKTYYCDQTNPKSISELWNNNDLQQEFDIIIEDGLHTFDSNVCFFENSLHRLKDNGYFIIEDIQGHHLDKMIEKCQYWNNHYPNITAEVLKIKNPNNDYDNTIVLVQKINLISKLNK